MSKKVKETKKEIKNNNKPPKKKMTSYERTKVGMKIAGILMALLMIFGAIMTVAGMFIGA